VPETPLSLLERLRATPDAVTWQRWVDLYAPLIRDWLHRHGLQPNDADDLSQDVLTAVVRELPNFRHDLRRGAFRRWLRTITVNRVRGFWRNRKNKAIAAGGDQAELVLAQLADPESGLSQMWDAEHDQFVTRRLLELLEPEFEANTWGAFRALVLDGEPTKTVAERFGLTVNAVRIAKSRVLSRFRQEAAGLLD
jgi:RNA polymerase sigma-70 factor (ECF subfamily)